MLRVFVNGKGVDVPSGATALDAARAWNETAAADVIAGRQRITDSRGLPIDHQTAMSAGSILRLVPVRDRDAHDDTADDPQA